MSGDWLSNGVSSVAEGRYLFGICRKTCISCWKASVFFSCLIFAKCCILRWDVWGRCREGLHSPSRYLRRGSIVPPGVTDRTGVSHACTFLSWMYVAFPTLRFRCRGGGVKGRKIRGFTYIIMRYLPLISAHLSFRSSCL